MEKKFLVVDDAGTEAFVDVFDTLEEANSYAIRQWQRLTRSERKGRSIYVGFTENTDDYYYLDEMGAKDEFDWAGYHSIDSCADGFDSDKRYTVECEVGATKTQPCSTVDYMRVVIEECGCEPIELYAKRVPDGNGYDGYAVWVKLQQEIIAQAFEHNILPDQLIFP